MTRVGRRAGHEFEALPGDKSVATRLIKISMLLSYALIRVFADAHYRAAIYRRRFAAAIGARTLAHKIPGQA